MTAGCLKPCIYLPIHLISDYREADMRYILLHELQHCRHRDNLVNILMNLAGILYWFHPLVWYGLKEMRTERELPVTPLFYKCWRRTLMKITAAP